MSRIIVDSLRGNSASSDAITLANDGTCTANITNNLSNRNLLINGDHRIAQRGTAAVTATTTASYKCVDRWKTDIDGSSGGDFSHAQSTDVPTGQGFTHSSKITTVTQVSQPSGTTNKHQFYTQLEKQDVAHLEWGTSDAKTCTISFWVKSSVTGTYLFYLKYYGATNYSYYTNYTINSADTWEKKTITITGHTSGGKVSGTTDVGLMIEWGLGYGSGFETGTLNEWTTSDTQRLASGSVYLPEHSGATWYLTGCQFEVGSIATDYEFKSYAQELALCQRYCYVIPVTDDDFIGNVSGYAHSTTNLKGVFHLPQVMRAYPTYTGTNTAARARAGNTGANFDLDTLTVGYGDSTNPNPTAWGFTVTTSSVTGGQGILLQGQASGSITFDAEL